AWTRPRRRSRKDFIRFSTWIMTTSLYHLVVHGYPPVYDEPPTPALAGPPQPRYTDSRPPTERSRSMLPALLLAIAFFPPAPMEPAPAPESVPPLLTSAHVNKAGRLVWRANVTRYEMHNEKVEIVREGKRLVVPVSRTIARSFGQDAHTDLKLVVA